MSSRFRILWVVALGLMIAAPAWAGGKIVIESSQLKPDRAAGAIRIELPPYDPEADRTPSNAPVVGLEDVQTVLFDWARRGEAAGNRGDLYDNRDRDHSNMRHERFPQLTFVEYSDELKKRNVDYGVQPGFLFNRVTIGNSSTAQTGPLWRSNARACYTNPRLAHAMIRQYVSNHIYVYPEHLDHDVGHNGRSPGAPKDGHGDVFPTNTPYILISQGSSGSDRDFLEALACTLAAYRPDVKQKLAERGMIAPVTQWVLRRTYGDTRTREDYLSGAAHPTVFDGKRLNRRLMVEMAHALTLDDIPPLARLSVTDESLGTPGVDYAAPGPMERMLDSPFVVARIHRSARRTYSMVVDARPFPPVENAVANVRFEWSLLRGDPERVRIKPLAEDGSRVRIEVDYHERMPIAPGARMESNRVDIGCFADNGKLLSAPSFVTIYTLDSERRTYDAAGRIVEIEHGAASYAVRGMDWPKLVRWLAAADPKELAWLHADLTPREIDAVSEAARAYAAAREKAMGQPEGPERKKLLDAADSELSLERPGLGGSLRLSIRRAIDRFVNSPESINRVQAAEPSRLEQVIQENARETWVVNLKAAIRSGLVQPPSGEGEPYRIQSRVRWPAGETDRLTGVERFQMERVNAGLLTRLTPGGAIRSDLQPNYVDPLLWTRCEWRDVYHYAPGVAEPIGWTRFRAEAEPQRFTAQGWRVTETDDRDRPLTAVEVAYEVDGQPPKSTLVQKDTTTVHRFKYTGPDDPVGRVE